MPYMRSKLTAAFTVICFFITLNSATAQDKTWPPKKWPHDPKNCHHLLSNTHQCDWKFFDIKGILEGTIVTYCSANGDKDGLSSVSVAVVKTAKETVRVIFTGNAPHKAGEHIKIIAAKEPESDLMAPFDRDYYITEEKKGNKPGCRVNEYDNTILKTAWGTITK